MRLEGRRVLVLGASSGLGKSSALEVAREGGRVCVAARRTVDALTRGFVEDDTGPPMNKKLRSGASHRIGGPSRLGYSAV